MQKEVETLSGPELDYWVARAEGFYGGDLDIRPVYGCSYYDGTGLRSYSPTTRWDQAGEIIEREQISMTLQSGNRSMPWHAFIPFDPKLGERLRNARGQTQLEAAMRAYVCYKIGPVVDREHDTTPTPIGPGGEPAKRPTDKLPAIVEMDKDRQDAWL